MLKLFDIKDFEINNGANRGNFGNEHIDKGIIVYINRLIVKIYDVYEDEIRKFPREMIISVKQIRLKPNVRKEITKRGKKINERLNRLNEYDFLNEIQANLNNQMINGLQKNGFLRNGKFNGFFSINSENIKIELMGCIDIQKGVNPSSYGFYEAYNGEPNKLYKKTVSRIESRLPTIKEKKNPKSIIKFKRKLSVGDKNWLFYEPTILIKLKTTRYFLHRKEAIKIARLLEFK
jgi:hypothetical protein